MRFPGNFRCFLLIILISLAISACLPERPADNFSLASTPDQTPEVSLPSATPSPTQKPSSTPTLPPTFTPSPTPSNTPSKVPTQTSTATPEKCESPGTLSTGSYTSQIAGSDMAYRIYLPPCYGKDGHTYPVLYMFHGNVSTDSQWDDLGLDEAAEELILAGEISPLIIVMPGGGTIANNSSGGPYSFEGVILNELIPHIEANYCAWYLPAGRALGGLSRGGYWSLEIAFRNASKVASVGAHSAALVDTHAGPDLNPQFTGLSNDLGNLRIYMDIGAEDWYITNIRRLHEDMEKAGIPHTWVLNDGIHEDPYWADHVSDYLRWYSEGWSNEGSAFPPCEAGQ